MKPIGSSPRIALVPPPLEAGTVLALDLGASRIRSAVIDPTGRVVARREARTPSAEGPGAVVAACAERLRASLAGLADEAPDLATPEAIGISTPGPVDPFDGIVLDPPNLGSGFRDVPLAAEVSAALGLPAWLDRDTQVAAMAEGVFGAARGVADYLYLTVSTGVGGAVVSDGRLLRGPDGVAGELGHLVIDRDGPPCGCGGRGHLEAIVSGRAIARAARQAVDGGAGGELAAMVGRYGVAFEARHVAEAAAAGDPTASAILADGRDAFAVACVSLVDVFNPSLIVVGGSVARGGGEGFLDPARAAVAREAFRRAAARARIVPAGLGDDVGLVGAVVLVAGRRLEAGDRT